VVQTVFDYARAQFKDLKTFFFHNTIYDTLWGDPPLPESQRISEFAKLDPETAWSSWATPAWRPMSFWRQTARSTPRSAAAGPALNA